MVHYDKTIQFDGKDGPLKEVILASYTIEVSGGKTTQSSGDFSVVDDQAFMGDLENCGTFLP